LTKTISEKGLHFDVVLFMIKTNVAKIRRMEDNIMIILHHSGGLERNEYQRYEGAANDLNICLNSLTTDKHLLPM